VVVASLVVAGCTKSGLGSSDPASQSVTSGQVQLDVSESFRALLVANGLHVVWTPPPCSWRLEPPACGGAARTDGESLVMPVVGGAVSVWSKGQKLRGRIELAGRLEVLGTGAAVSLDDMTVDPAASLLTAAAGSSRIDALFLDGTAASFDNGGGRVEVKGVEVKLLGALGDRIRDGAGAPVVPELVKVGDLAMVVVTGRRGGAG
jgi:hypothetical protein